MKGWDRKSRGTFAFTYRDLEVLRYLPCGGQIRAGVHIIVIFDCASYFDAIKTSKTLQNVSGILLVGFDCAVR